LVRDLTNKGGDGAKQAMKVCRRRARGYNWQQFRRFTGNQLA
jgi:hypothetical protein